MIEIVATPASLTSTVLYASNAILKVTIENVESSSPDISYGGENFIE